MSKSITPFALCQIGIFWRILESVKAKRSQVIDEFGELNRQIQAFGPKFERFKELRAEILEWCEDEPADRPVEMQGRCYTLRISARELQRKVKDKIKAFELLSRLIGKKAAVELISIPLKAAIDKFIPAEKHASILTSGNTGPREIDVVERVARLKAA